MSRFNVKSKGTKTTNLAGGESFKQSKELELVSILLTSFAQNQFYRSANDTFKKLESLVDGVDPLFAAKSAIFARTKFGMRSITHVLAGLLAKRLSGEPWAKNFYNSVVYRPDDITEILSYYKSINNNGNPTNAMRKGLAMSFNKFDEYQLSKYRGEGKSLSLVDAVNIVRPRPTEKNAIALNKLVKGTLKSKNTWESKLTKAGQESKSEKEKAEMKATAWKDLLSQNKLGYFALLRNLRNILEQAPVLVDIVCDMLINRPAIKKSLVLPFRFLSAVSELQKVNYEGTRKVLGAINQAIDISLDNVPSFEGKTLIVLDTSKSMKSMSVAKTNLSVSLVGGLFGAALYKRNPNVDFMVFDSTARYVTLNPGDSLITTTGTIPFRGGSTNFKNIFKEANKAYDRIIILSDMQGWVGYYSPNQEYNTYCKNYKCSPHVYSFDLAGYGTLQFPERNVYCLAGFSDKVFDIMKLLEQDKNALVKEINRIEFCV